MELTIDQALQQGVEAHKAGTGSRGGPPLHRYSKSYSLSTLMRTTTWVCWLLGVGKVQEALPFFKTALEANPAIAQYLAQLH